MKNLDKIQPYIRLLTKQELEALLDYIKRDSIIKDNLMLEDIVASGCIADNVHMFLSDNTLHIHENSKLSTVNDRYALATIAEYYNQIKVSPSLLTKLPRLSVIFNPYSTERIYDKSFNTFTPSSYIQFASSVQKRDELDMNHIKSFKHIYTVLKNLFKTDVNIEYFLNWLSTIINTRRKTGVCIILKGAQGTGKNFLFDNLIKRAFYVSENADYAIIFDNDRLRNRFNGGLAESLFVCFNEIKGDFRDSSTTADTMKTLITDGKIQIERKGRDAQNVLTYFNSIMFSNHSVPFQIEMDDRRFTVIETNNEKLNEVVAREHHMNMHQFVTQFDKEADEFLRYIIAVKYSITNATIPLQTKEKLIVAQASTSQLLKLSHALKTRNIESLQFIYDKFNEIYSSDEMPRPQFEIALKKLLKETAKGAISTQSLKFAYKFYINSKSDKNKIERDLLSEFGETKKGSGFCYKKIGTSIDFDTDKFFSNHFSSDDMSICDLSKFQYEAFSDDVIINGVSYIFTSETYIKVKDDKTDDYDYIPYSKQQTSIR